jgi:hypothetical protein
MRSVCGSLAATFFTFSFPPALLIVEGAAARDQRRIAQQCAVALALHHPTVLGYSLLDTFLVRAVVKCEPSG